MNFGKRLKELREEKNISAKTLSLYLNCSLNSVYDWEHSVCEPSIDTLCKLADFFSTTVDFLIARVDEFGIPLNTKDPWLSSDQKQFLKYFSILGTFERETMLIQLKALANSKIKT